MIIPYYLQLKGIVLHFTDGSWCRCVTVHGKQVGSVVDVDLQRVEGIKPLETGRRPVLYPMHGELWAVPRGGQWQRIWEGNYRRIQECKSARFPYITHLFFPPEEEQELYDYGGNV